MKINVVFVKKKLIDNHTHTKEKAQKTFLKGYIYN